MNAPNLKADRCPGCGYKVDSANLLGSEDPVRPRPGDFSICLNCGQLNRYDRELNLVAGIPEDESLLSAETFAQVRKAQRFIQQRGLIA